MTVDEAIREVLTVSTDIRRVALFGADGEVLGAGPEEAAPDVAAAASQLWEAAERRAGAGGDITLDHVVVQDPASGVAMVREGDRRAVALTGPDPAVGLLLFDLRTCLADSLAQDDAPAEAEAASDAAAAVTADAAPDTEASSEEVTE